MLLKIAIVPSDSFYELWKLEQNKITYCPTWKNLTVMVK